MPIDFPNSPSTNQTYSSGGVTWRWDGAKWRLVGGITQPKVQVSDTPPTGASAGDAWLETDTGSLFVFQDGFWVAARVPNVVGSGAIGTTQLAGGAVTTEKLALGPTFVSALPSSPVDGQEIYYQASGDMATNGIVWHLRYRSGSSSSYKWECVGGGSLRTDSGTNSQFTSTWTSLTGTVTVPLAGDYQVAFGAMVYGDNSTLRDYYLKASVATPGTGAGNTDNSAQGYTNNTGPGRDQTHRISRLNGLAASDAIAIWGKCSSNTTNSEQRNITVIPIRVG